MEIGALRRPLRAGAWAAALRIDTASPISTDDDVDDEDLLVEELAIVARIARFVPCGREQPVRDPVFRIGLRSSDVVRDHVARKEPNGDPVLLIKLRGEDAAAVLIQRAAVRWAVQVGVFDRAAGILVSEGVAIGRELLAGEVCRGVERTAV